jgi:Domain of unknown function (DUF3854)
MVSPRVAAAGQAGDPGGAGRVNPHFDFLLSAVYDGLTLHPDHAADLAKSSIGPATIATHKIRSVPPHMIDRLLGFNAPAAVESALLFPFPDPCGGFMDYVKMRVFPELADVRGDHVEEHRQRYRYNAGRTKYLVRRRSSPRLYVPIPTMRRALEGDEPLWLCEGMKKALAVAQLDLPAVAIESAWGWHVKGSRSLLPDFDAMALTGRVVKMVPDPDAQTNPEIARAMHRLAVALEQRRARVQFVLLPQEVAA